MTALGSAMIVERAQGTGTFTLYASNGGGTSVLYLRVIYKYSFPSVYTAQQSAAESARIAQEAAELAESAPYRKYKSIMYRRITVGPTAGEDVIEVTADATNTIYPYKAIVPWLGAKATD